MNPISSGHVSLRFQVDMDKYWIAMDAMRAFCKLLTVGRLMPFCSVYVCRRIPPEAKRPVLLLISTCFPDSDSKLRDHWGCSAAKTDPQQGRKPTFKNTDHVAEGLRAHENPPTTVPELTLLASERLGHLYFLVRGGYQSETSRALHDRSSVFDTVSQQHASFFVNPQVQRHCVSSSVPPRPRPFWSIRNTGLRVLRLPCWLGIGLWL